MAPGSYLTLCGAVGGPVSFEPAVKGCRSVKMMSQSHKVRQRRS